MSLSIEQNYQNLSEKYQQTIIDIAFKSIKCGIENRKPLEVDLKNLPPEFNTNGSCFVTIEKNGDLRGCIGSIIAYRPLAVDIAENAYASAFRDKRFPQLDAGELSQITISVSLLTPYEEMSFQDEKDLLSQLRPNIDGLIIEDVGKRAVFLPVVWEHFDYKEDFLNNLRLKAGLSANHFSKTFKAYRFLSISVKQKS